MPIPRARRMNLVALALLITALIAVVVFHFTVFVQHPEMDPLVGWQIWPEIWSAFSRPDFSDATGLIASMAFCTSALLFAVSPLIFPFLSASRLAWWLVTGMSGTVLVGVSGTLIANYFPAEPGKLGIGFFTLIAAQLLHFAGLLFIRREAAPEPMLERP